MPITVTISDVSVLPMLSTLFSWRLCYKQLLQREKVMNFQVFHGIGKEAELKQIWLFLYGVWVKFLRS